MARLGSAAKHGVHAHEHSAQAHLSREAESVEASTVTLAPGDGPVTKALVLLDAFAEAEQPLRFADLRDRLPFPKATLHRMLKSLVDERMLALHAPTGTYQLGPRLIRLAHATWAHGSLVDAARSVLDALHTDLGKTIHLAQLDSGQVLYLDKRVGNRGLAMFSRPGKVGPGYCTGIGKAMLAHLPPDALEEALAQQTFRPHTPHTLTSSAALRAELLAIRDRGHAFDREEHEPGIICIAVPILGEGGALYGGLSATGPGTVEQIDTLTALAPRLKTAARVIAAEAAIRMAPTLT
ncbi:MAG: IclR family transcriptional regulator [Devosiaceae bacterium]|nr:IclR family transcriptional regulator [Devosiaceae bacterium MH13]